MPAAKKTPRPSKRWAPLSARAFEAFAVEVRGQFADIRGHLAGHDGQFSELRGQIVDLRDHMDQRFAQVDRRFEEVDHRFEQIDHRFEQIDHRFEQIDHRLDLVHGDIGRLQAASMEHGRRLRVIQQSHVAADEVEAVVERVLARGGRQP